jgi:hypothetical protein
MARSTTPRPGGSSPGPSRWLSWAPHSQRRPDGVADAAVRRRPGPAWRVSRGPRRPRRGRPRLDQVRLGRTDATLLARSAAADDHVKVGVSHRSSTRSVAVWNRMAPDSAGVVHPHRSRPPPAPGAASQPTDVVPTGSGALWTIAPRTRHVSNSSHPGTLPLLTPGKIRPAFAVTRGTGASGPYFRLVGRTDGHAGDSTSVAVAVGPAQTCRRDWGPCLERCPHWSASNRRDGQSSAGSAAVAARWVRSIS